MPLNESTVPYSTAERLYAQFGRFNIRAWADVDGTGDDAAIDAAIDSAILDASRIFDDTARNGVIKLPFKQGEVPRSVQYAVACRAAWQLYCSRGMYVKDWDKAFDKIICEFERVANKIHDGSMRLAIDTDEYVAGMSPGAVSDGY